MFAAKNIIGIVGINGKYFFKLEKENENFQKSFICPMFLAVQDSSIGDLVTHSLSESVRLLISVLQ